MAVGRLKESFKDYAREKALERAIRALTREIRKMNRRNREIFDDDDDEED